MQTPQIEPVTSMVRDHKAIFEKLKKGPVFLAQRSRPAAVLVSVDQWDAQADELARLRRIIEADRQFAAMDAGDVVEFDYNQAPTA